MFTISDVSDGLCNGAMGELIAVEEHQDETVNKMVVKFDNPSTGSTNRENYPAYNKKYPGGTVIKLKEIEYSIARTKSLISSTAKLIQYPLIAAFAITGKVPPNKFNWRCLLGVPKLWSLSMVCYSISPFKTYFSLMCIL